MPPPELDPELDPEASPAPDDDPLELAAAPDELAPDEVAPLAAPASPSCSATIGDGSSFTCLSGAVCDVVCTGSCSASSHGGTLTVKCGSDAMAKAVDAATQCQ